MDKHYQDARRAVGLPKFERECRCIVAENRKVKAYKVPGTREAGRYAMLRQMAADRAGRSRKES